MKAKITIAALVLCSMGQGLFAQPLVYNAENTGAGCTPPPLPAFSTLPRIEPLPDPFLWADPNKPRSSSFSDWECHRNEFKAQIENYEIGIKPLKPDSLTASYVSSSATAGTLTVIVKRNGQTLTLTSQVALPAVAGPWPAIIGMNSASGSIPATVFTSRNIARITYNHNNVTTYGGPSLNDPFYRLYPEYNLVNAGQYSAWAWGVSRIIDGLELVQASLPIKLDKLGVTGCSYAGKMALFSGAFDERIALTIAQESGGGGAPAWRVSETLGAVEKLGATDYTWFRDSMRLFAGINVPKLPHDHHELMAMVAPRALLVTGNTDFEWLANPATYVSARAAKSVYNTLGISDRFGFYIDGGHGHCAVPNNQVPAIQAFVDKFMANIPNVNTDTVTVNPYPNMNYQRWFQWWGSGNPILPPLPPDPPVSGIYMEAECAAVGTTWSKLTDTTASNGTYVVVNGLNSTASAPAGNNAVVVFTFNIDTARNYNFRARINCPTGDDDSYWIKVDNGTFSTINNLGTAGWQWVQLANATLSVGIHTFTIAYREDGAKLDKLLVTTSTANVPGLGETATNCATVCNTALGSRLYVDTSATGSGNGATWGCAFKQLTEAIKYANTNSSIKEIWVADGIYKATTTRGAQDYMELTRADLRILGGFSGNETAAAQANPTLNPTIISGDIGVANVATDNSPLMLVIHDVPTNASRLVIDGFIFERAYADQPARNYGGAIIAFANSATTPVQIRRTIFRNNTSTNLAGALYMDRSPIEFDSCRFTGNASEIGGAIFSFQSAPVFKNCVFAANTATSYGGVYYSNYGLTRFINCAFNGNTAVFGGAVYQNKANVEYYNPVMSNNTATEQGGGVYQHNESNTLFINATVFGNAARYGGGVTLGSSSRTTIWNSLFYRNTAGGADNVPNADILNTENLSNTIRYTALQQNTTVPTDNGSNYSNNIRTGINPQFTNQANPAGADGIWFTGDDGLQVAKLSPHVNAGSNSLIGTATDVKNEDRIACTTVDMGAYEQQVCADPFRVPSADPAIAGAINNPFSSDLQIRYSGEEKANIRITSLSGKVMAVSATAAKGVTHVNAATWTRGIYNVEIITTSGKKINFKAIRL